MVRKAAKETSEKAGIGHNHTIAREELLLLIERVERLEEEKKATGDDIKDVYAEAKARGFCPKMMKRMIRLRKLETVVLREQEALRETYMVALGLDFGDTPLGKASGMGRRLSVSELAGRLQAMGATVKVSKGIHSIVIPAGMKDAELDLPEAEPEPAQEKPLPIRTARDPSDGGLVTLAD